jgi:hypothetical protein
MSEIVLNIKNEEKGKFLLDFLKQIEFVEIKNRTNKKINRDKDVNFKDLYGIWKGRDINLEMIRKKAWKER